ncbi:hypothetical protein AGABI2DRAFT_120697 [Agaricus bisporus var. bisporus H97]|uniref:hypothetical protein n=1 Tax=Agaricus bisporus var. bisporus (strain H97 / ATCC MYA-4626 / FGSC 10389) TaxID=936046 RepID=UPI00029F6B9A|nr:hypothetical protein AGABI2DRAFT_120697 [Agaricus bisporus var. bisporus H97]EKV44583.1 hypothetical protein AGABI2DRAFT_120697 [Agaricus bisporus var. bisporus H97]
MERAELEIVPTSQESEKEFEELKEERRVSRRYEEDFDEEEVEESSDEENDDVKAIVVFSQIDFNIWNQFSTPPAELMTTPPLPSPLDASQSMYGFPTPLPSTPGPPRVEGRAYTSPHPRGLAQFGQDPNYASAANDTDSNVMTGVSMSTNQFEENVNKSKEIVGKIVDEEIQSSSPDLLSEPWTFTEDQVVGFRENLNGILNSMARITPRMATNPDAIARELALFVSRIINSEWADVNVGHMSIASAIREAATFQTPLDVPPPPPVKNVKFAPTPIPTPASALIPMEVDTSPPRIPAAAKGKKKASPIPPTPQHPGTTSPVIASPIKISAVPKPLVQPSKTGKQGKPVTSYMPIKLSVVTKPTATNETLAGVTPRMPESGFCRQGMGKDASGSNAPSASAVPAAGRSRDASGSNAPPNPPKSGKGAPGKSGASTTAEHGTRPGPTPVPMHSKPNSQSRSNEMKNNARAFVARIPKSYAQVAKQSAAPTAPAPIVMNETIQWAMALKEQCPEMTMQDALKAVAPVVNTPQSSNEVIVPKSKKALAAQKAAQGITGGLNQKSAQFAFSHIVQPERFGDMGKVVDAMNRYLVFHKSQMRVQNGRLFKNVVHFYLNLVPSKQGFMLIRELLYKALEVELPEGDSDLPNAPQSVAHLILKGFDYHTSQYNKRPEDILTGDLLE